jgi:metal-responsive CopG/Arc/MetJ family transcriptional regulator
MRTIVDLHEEQIRALDACSKKHGVSRAEAVRWAVAIFLPKRQRQKLDFQNHAAFGSWKNREIDSLKYQSRRRAEWDDRS